MELSEEKQLILTQSNNKSIVIASAASGKTALLTEKVRQLLRAGIPPSKMAVITFTNMAAGELRKRLGADYKDGLFMGTIHSLANYFLLSSGIRTHAVLENENFDELFEMVSEHPECIKSMDWIILDEAQDSSPIQFQFLFDMIRPEHFFVVGDPKQCQPAGTQVLLRGGQTKDIADIEVGDDLVWYSPTNGYCCALNATAYNSVHKYVLQIQKRPFMDDFLITIKTDRYESKYTPNHRTFIKMRDDTNYVSAVYLMCNNENRFRVGKIALTGTKTRNGNPWRMKMTDEGCSKIWLLKIFKTNLEARVYEQKISYKYQIPQLCWQTDKVEWTPEQIDYIYESLDTFKNATQCLFDHQLDINYPLIDKNLDWSFNQKFAINASSQLYAINIIPEIMDCLVYDTNNENHSHKKFEHIISIEKDFITKEKPIDVYSLNVEGGTYVADGIITHNSIYQWNGGNPRLISSLAIEHDADVFTLNENYRNGFNILSYAKRITRRAGNDDDSICMTDAPGLVIESDFNPSRFIEMIQENPNYKEWAILTRTNKEIEEMALRLSKAEIPYDTFKQGDLTNAQLGEKMAQNTVKILTIHSAKGLEWDNVIVIGTRFTSSEEVNVCYVAATRARKLLVWSKGIKKVNRIKQW